MPTRLPPRMFPGAVIFAATMAAFWPVLDANFVNWDDNYYIGEYAFRGLGPANITAIFTGFVAGHYTPIAWLTYSLDYILGGLDPRGYHFTNLLAHSLMAGAFFFLAADLLQLAAKRKDSGKGPSLLLGASFAALVFSLHPLRVESVAWVTQRRDVVSGFFGVITVIFYLRAAATGEGSRARRRFYLASLATFALMLLSRETTVVLAPVLIVLDVFPLRRLGGALGWLTPAARRIWREKIPYFAMSLSVGAAQVAARLYTVKKPPSPFRDGVFDWLARFFYSVYFYLEKTLLPTGLSPTYFNAETLTFADAPALRGAVVTVGLTILLFALRRRFPAGIAAWCAYLLMLAPFLGVVKAEFVSIVADHYATFSCLPWALLAGAALQRSWEAGEANPRLRGAAIAGGLAVAVGLVLLTRPQIRIWKDTESLWRGAIAAGEDHYKVRLFLGQELFKKGDLDGARTAYERALETNPKYHRAFYGLAEVAAERRHSDLAIAHFQRALEFGSDRAQVQYGIGLVRFSQGDLEGAERRLRAAVEADPAFALARMNLGLLYGNLGRADEGKIQILRAMALDRTLAAVGHFQLGRISLRRNQVEEAKAHFDSALGMEPNFIQAYLSRAEALRLLGENDAARADYRKGETLARNPLLRDTIRRALKDLPGR